MVRGGPTVCEFFTDDTLVALDRLADGLRSAPSGLCTTVVQTWGDEAAAASAGHLKKPDLLRVRPVERTNRLGSGLQHHLAALFAKYASASGDRYTFPIWPEPRMSWLAD